MKLSVIVIAYDMPREIPRTLQSLAPHYQVESGELDYEVLVIDNGSQRPLDSSLVEALPSYVHYHYLESPPPSPAYALNYAAARARGEILCLMIDGAHVLTPGVFKYALSAFRAFPSPVVLTRYFFLGPGDQNDTILEGYNQEAEDGLMGQINWPGEGYRLFEIGEPLKGNVPVMNWFNKMIESNCIFLPKRVYEEIGGADERFDLPGGGFLNLDLYRQAAEHPDTQVVQLIGEGSFHQFHGGTTTNVSPEERDAKVAAYKTQYRDIRGEDLEVSAKEVQYLGHLPTLHSKIHLRNRVQGEQEIPPELKAKILAGQ